MIALDEFVDRLCRLGADRGPRGFPSNPRDRDILVKSILLGLDSDATYSERAINEHLKAWKRDVAPAIETDHVTLRRLLVDLGHLDRTPDGRAYGVGFPLRSPEFALEVHQVDLRATIAAYLEQAAARRAAAKARAATRESAERRS
jgi:hypothetical protein